ncbi:MAG: hypothetical protein Q9178_005329 [Gyalolechia marmorata]
MSRPKSSIVEIQRATEAMGFGVIEDTSSPNALCDDLSSLDSTVDKNRQRVLTMEAYLPLRTALGRQANLTFVLEPPCAVLMAPIMKLDIVPIESLSKEPILAMTRSSLSKTESNEKDGPTLETRLPDIEVMPLATSAMDDLEEHKRYFSKSGVFSLLATLLRPKSRGTVRLRSPDPHDRPKVDLDLLSDPEDSALARKAVRLAMKLGDAIKAQDFPLLRGISVPVSDQSAEDMDQFIRHRARTTYVSLL